MTYREHSHPHHHHLRDGAPPLDSEIAILEMQIATAQQHAAQVSAQAHQARESVTPLVLKAIQLHWGVEPGTLVQVAHHSSLNPAPKPGLWKVTRVRAEFNRTRRPWVEAVKQKKDGSWGIQPRNLFNDWVAQDWENTGASLRRV